MNPSIKVVRRSGGYGWVLKCKYGKVIAESITTYKTKASANYNASDWAIKFCWERIDIERIK